jgi:hypothetical protein
MTSKKNVMQGKEQTKETEGKEQTQSKTLKTFK